MSSRFGLKVIAAIEAAKGAVVLAAGLGLFELMHRDVQEGAERLVRNMHLNPASHYPRVFLEATARLDKPDLRLLALGALAYALVRFIEAFGLWRARRWAEWFGALSGSVYLPLEVFKLWELVTWPRITVLFTNVVVVVYLASILVRASAGPPKATAA
ncbi:MAG TPA: DUF2127 domain-containing protein [Opitutaceae bacterium]|nr:DUF2127 domain-containing protein [Opitutaceae bacterium]